MDNIELKRTNEQFHKLGQEIVDFMKDFLVSNDKIKTGKLKESINYEVNISTDKTEININSLKYMNQVDRGMKVKPYSTRPSYIERLKYKGQNVPATDIYQKTTQWIINNKTQDISDAAADDINNYIKNLFNNI